uniref:Uncharacterized protein n=1 Tax=viral metagenome TaxID=1070528 RepID=A0A6H1ZBP3_9ZZZZ
MKERNPRIWPRITISKKDDKHRFMWCSFYDKCLVEASRKYWPSFTCYFCQNNPLAKRKEGEDYGKRT